MYIRIVEEGLVCYANASALMGVKDVSHHLITPFHLSYIETL